MRITVLFIVLFIAQQVLAQNTFKAIIKSNEGEDAKLLIGAIAVLQDTSNGATADQNGLIELNNIPNGRHIIVFSYIGYKTKADTFDFPTASSKLLLIFLTPDEDELNEVIVQSDRSSRRLEDTPTKIDIVSAEELNEKGEANPADIKQFFNETTGIATQQTSAVSGATNIRMQGLDGQYTQLLKDGMPLYEGFSEGLSVIQITPLDLKQVEFVKGSASTLYGGGAIAGLVNLITKTPEEKKELTFLLNGTSAGGYDASEFYSQKWKTIGTTIFSSYNTDAAYDPSNIGLSAIPKTTSFTINPKLFLYFNEKTSGWFGVNTTYDNRLGGDIKVIEGETDSIHQYFERNKTVRVSTQLSFSQQIDENSNINFKNSVGLFNREILHPDESFNGQQVSSFSEINYIHTKPKSEWIAGLNFLTDNTKSLDINSNLNYNLSTLGAFAQNTFKANKLTLETGLRIDDNTPATKDQLKGVFILPRINALMKFDNHWSSRLGAGLGYKMPSPFNDQAENEGYNNIQPLSLSNLQAVKSDGGSADVLFKTSAGEITFSVDQLFFYTYLNNPLVLQGNSFVNANGFIDSKGGETNIKLGIDELIFYVGYTYTDAIQHFNGQEQWQLLTPKHLLYIDADYEAKKKFRTGIEADYKSEQALSDGTTGRGYFVFGFLFEKIWAHLNAFINAENIFDIRQDRWGNIYTGTITSPVFKDIYAPLEGRIVNAGIKIKL